MNDEKENFIFLLANSSFLTHENSKSNLLNRNFLKIKILSFKTLFFDRNFIFNNLTT